MHNLTGINLPGTNNDASGPWRRGPEDPKNLHPVLPRFLPPSPLSASLFVITEHRFLGKWTVKRRFVSDVIVWRWYLAR